MKSTYILLICLLFYCLANCQIHWDYKLSREDKSTYNLIVKGTMGRGWHVMSPNTPEKFTFAESVKVLNEKDSTIFTLEYEEGGPTAWYLPDSIQNYSRTTYINIKYKVRIVSVNKILKWKVCWQLGSKHGLLEPEFAEFKENLADFDKLLEPKK